MQIRDNPTILALALITAVFVVAGAGVAAWAGIPASGEPTETPTATPAGTVTPTETPTSVPTPTETETEAAGCEGDTRLGYNESSTDTYYTVCEPTATQTPTTTPTQTATVTEDDDTTSGSPSGSDAPTAPLAPETETETETPTQTPADPSCEDPADQYGEPDDYEYGDEYPLEYVEYDMIIADRFVVDLLETDGVTHVAQGTDPATGERVIYVEVADGADADLYCQIEGYSVVTDRDAVTFGDDSHLWAADGIASHGVSDSSIRFLLDQEDVETVTVTHEHQPSEATSKGYITAVSVEVVPADGASAPYDFPRYVEKTWRIDVDE